jgi:hypothetical protein
MLNKVVRPRETVDDAFVGYWVGSGTEVYRQLDDKDAVKKISYKVKMRISKMPESQYRIESEYFYLKKTKIRGTVFEKDEQSGEYNYDAMIGDENSLQALTSYTDDDLSSKILESFRLSEQDANLLHHNYTGRAIDWVFPQIAKQRQALLGRIFAPAPVAEPMMLVTANFHLKKGVDEAG